LSFLLHLPDDDLAKKSRNIALVTRAVCLLHHFDSLFQFHDARVSGSTYTLILKIVARAESNKQEADDRKGHWDFLLITTNNNNNNKNNNNNNNNNNQSIPGDLKYKDAAAMLQVQTREANEECFVIGNQHGRHDVT